MQYEIRTEAGQLRRMDWGSRGQITMNGVSRTAQGTLLSGMADQPENASMVTCRLTAIGHQATLMLTQRRCQTQHEVDRKLEQGWRPVLHALRQLFEGTRQ
ncbi:MAG TPA: hypothetical protein VGN32_05375 [Ktedonobacterales bacterium]|nr:hypothetical protein [Ktedonobacterales bacterium]